MISLRFLFMAILMTFAISLGYAEGPAGPNIGSMFASFTTSAVELSKLVNVGGYIIGGYLIINSIFKFTKVNQQGGSLKGAITMFVCGIALFAITGSVGIALSTMSLGDTSGPGTVLQAVGTDGMPAEMKAAITGVLTFIKLIGYIAFIRGWLLLNAAGNGKDGAFFRGLTHIFGGVAAININITAKIVGNTIAPGMVIPGIG